MKYYIVYHLVQNRNYKSARDPNFKGGYYVGYKDKLSDRFSTNWLEAKRYKSLETAFRNQFYGGHKMGYANFRSFIKDMETNPELLREKKLSKLIGSKDKIDFPDFLNNRRIEIVDVLENDIKHLGVFSGNELYEFLKQHEAKLYKKLPINNRKNAELYKEVEAIDDVNDDFWD